jgi:hypothetical protein
MIVRHKQYRTRQGNIVQINWHHDTSPVWDGYVIVPDQGNRQFHASWDKQTGKDLHPHKLESDLRWDLVEFTPDARLAMARKEMEKALEFMRRAMDMLKDDKE